MRKLFYITSFPRRPYTVKMSRENSHEYIHLFLTAYGPGDAKRVARQHEAYDYYSKLEIVSP